MNARQHLVLAMVGVLAAVVGVIALVVLFRWRAAYTRVTSELHEASNRMTELTRRAPFPSEANVKTTRDNLHTLDVYLNDIMAELRGRPLEPATMDPAEFPTLLETHSRRLRMIADESGVLLPEAFSLGFKRYVIEGASPDVDDLRRLVGQVRSLALIAEMILQSRIIEMVDITREIFEVEEEAVHRPGPRRSRRRGGGVAPHRGRNDHELYTRELYSFTFIAGEAPLLTVLNRLAKSDLFVVVKNIEVGVVDEEARRAAAASRRRSGSAPSAGRGVDRTRGPDTGPGEIEFKAYGLPGKLMATLDLEVYTFNTPADEAALR